MANTIKLKTSSVASKVPTTSDLILGELAINTFDGKVYLKKDDGTPTIVEVTGGTGGGGGTTIPAGVINQYAGATAPSGWLLCDGSAVSRSTYANLFSVLSTNYGAGDGTTTFNLPDLRRRIPVGKGTSDSLGGSDGLAEGSRTLSHTHSVPAHYHGMGTGATLNISASGGVTTGIESAGHSHSGTTDNQNALHTHAGSTTSGEGAHSHTIPGTTASTQNASGEFYRSTAGTADYTLSNGGTHVHTLSTGTESVYHQHTFTTGGVSANHTHSVPNHTHSSASISGVIGLVTGGVDGNAAMSSGSATQPYVIVNHIIKY